MMESLCSAHQEHDPECDTCTATSYADLINPGVLGYAREKAGLTLEQAAEKVPVDLETLREAEVPIPDGYDAYRYWASPGKGIILAQLRRLATLYDRPIEFFYLARVPDGVHCMSSIVFGDDHGDNSATFWCQLGEGHEGNHSETGVMGSDSGSQPFTLTWEGDAAGRDMGVDRCVSGARTDADRTRAAKLVAESEAERATFDPIGEEADGN